MIITSSNTWVDLPIILATQTDNVQLPTHRRVIPIFHKDGQYSTQITNYPLGRVSNLAKHAEIAVVNISHISHISHITTRWRLLHHLTSRN